MNVFVKKQKLGTRLIAIWIFLFFFVILWAFHVFADSGVYIYYQLFQSTNCQLRFFVRAAEGGFLPKVRMETNSINIDVPACGGPGKIDVMTNGLELRWDSTTNCAYQVESSQSLKPGSWTKLGIYAGKPIETRLSLPMNTSHKFFRIKSLCPSPFRLLSSVETINK